MYQKIDKCRICGNTQLVPVLDLGEQMLTGVFPSEISANITSGPLRLVKCMGGNQVCGLLQLEHSYDLGEMYGENYGYRSGLNPSMVKHLHGKVEKILAHVQLKEHDLVMDIGSNDGTTLQYYPNPGPMLVGFDPTGVKFRQYYPSHIQLIPDFFSATLFKERFPGQKAKVITSFSMFYDLEDPLSFMLQVQEVLADDGIWVFEQSYMPMMLEMNAYDTVCHEHLEYYSLQQIKWLADRSGFHIIDVEINDVNGGSFSVMVSKSRNAPSTSPSVLRLLDEERKKALDTLAPFKAFEERVLKSRLDLVEFIEGACEEGKTVAALGASTKGNVILQFCGFTRKEIFSVGEINADKFGCYTPGTWIPIISESDLLAKNPDYLIMMPWHFRKFFDTINQLKQFKLVFPLPLLDISRPPPKGVL